MQLSALELSLILNGKLEGNPDILVSKPSKIEEGKVGTVSFVGNAKYESYIYTTKASILIVDEKFNINKKIKPAVIKVMDAYESFTRILEYFDSDSRDKRGIEEQSKVSPSAELGQDVYIGSFAYVGDNVKVGDRAKIYPNVYLGDHVEVGEDTILYAGVKIYSNCKIGSKCIIHSGVVVGSDGFGFAPQNNGEYKKIPQLGNVIIEDYVEIGANTTIDRATVGSTVIKEGVKLDNLIQLAHNAEIDKGTVIAAQTGVSGSTKLGKNCMVGGQVGFVGHLKIADGSKINAQSGISKSITKRGQAWNGSPAFEYNESLKSQVYFKKLPELAKKIHELEKKLKKLEKNKK